MFILGIWNLYFNSDCPRPFWLGYCYVAVLWMVRESDCWITMGEVLSKFKGKIALLWKCFRPSQWSLAWSSAIQVVFTDWLPYTYTKHFVRPRRCKWRRTSPKPWGDPSLRGRESHKWEVFHLQCQGMPGHSESPDEGGAWGSLPMGSGGVWGWQGMRQEARGQGMLPKRVILKWHPEQ